MINRRPDEQDEFSMSWRLLPRLELRVLLYSDPDDRPAGQTQWWLRLRGRYKLNGHPAPLLARVRADRPCSVSLEPAARYEDGLLDMPWMEQGDIHYNTEKRAWLIILT